MLRTLLLALAAMAAFVALLAAMQKQLVFQASVPTRVLHADPSDIGLEYEELRIDTADGEELHAWWLPADEARANGYTVLHLHGNAGNIAHRLGLLEFFHELGFATLIIDYRGYGESSCSASESGVYRDAAAAWDHLEAVRGLAPEEIILHGHSLGAAIAAYQATQAQPAALALEGGFTSLPELAGDLYWWIPGARLLVRMAFDTQAHLRTLCVPVLLLHAEDDRIVPQRHAKALQDAAPSAIGPVWLHGGHNDALYQADNRRRYADALGDLLQAVEAAPGCADTAD